MDLSGRDALAKGTHPSIRGGESHSITRSSVFTSGAITSRRTPITGNSSTTNARGQPFELAGGHEARVDGHSTFPIPERQVQERRLPSHERGEGTELVDRHIGMEPDTALEGPSRIVVLDSPSVQHPCDRRRTGSSAGSNLSLGDGQSFSQRIFQTHRLGGTSEERVGGARAHSLSLSLRTRVPRTQPTPLSITIVVAMPMTGKPV